MGKRPSSTARGYTSTHRRVRRHWADIINRLGAVQCTCGRPECPYHDEPQCPVMITPGSTWDLGHDDSDRTIWTGPECVPCNRSAGGRNGAKVSNKTRHMVVRPW